jgi:hypothetical protein
MLILLLSRATITKSIIMTAVLLPFSPTPPKGNRSEKKVNVAE